MTKVNEYYADKRTSANLVYINHLLKSPPVIMLPRKIIPAWQEENLWRCVWAVGILTQAGVDKKRLQDLRHQKVLPANELEQRLLNLANLLRHADTLKNHLHQQEKVVKIYQQLLGGQDKLSIKRQLFKELMEWLFADERTHPLVRAGVAYKYLIEEKVFPLSGELMARLFLLLLLRYFGYQVAKMWVLEDYDLLNLSRFRGRLERPCLDDYAPWLDYFIKGVRYGLQVSYDSAYAWQEIVLASHSLTAAEKKTYQQLRDYAGAKNLAAAAEILGVSRQRAHVLLGHLVTKGVVERLGSGKKITFRLAYRRI